MAIDKRFFTSSVHAGLAPESTSGAVIPPIFQTSTFAQDSPGVHKGFDYSRATNPTRSAYELALAEIENAKFGLAFSSGLAAEQAIIQLLHPGSHVLVCDDVYGGTGRLFRRLFAKYGIEFDFVDMTEASAVANLLKTNTKLIWVETPSNPMLKLVDIAAVAQIAKKQKAIFVVDNTFASPVFQSPLLWGADIVMHSTTKYIGGHSDLIGGAIMLNDSALYEELKFVQFAAGAVPSPFECFLLHRSLKTLALRMQAHEQNALAVAHFLNGHKKVTALHYPGLKKHPQHALACKQMSGFSGMLSFEYKGDFSGVKQMIARLKIFTLAESLGGVESLVNHPELMTHASVPEELRRKLGIGPGLVRLSVGIEAPQDLIEDLQQALE